MNRLLALLYDAVADAFAPRTGFALSGGLDSATVVGLAHGLGQRPVAFTGYYDDAGCDERRYAHLVPTHRHYDVRITPEDFVGYFDAFAAAQRPLAPEGMGAFGQFMVGHRMAQHGVKVAISGEGADELFGGYARVMLVAGRALPDNYDGYELPESYPTTLEAALAWEMEHLQQLLGIDGQMMAAHGIEARAPFTDPLVVEYALGLAAEERVGKDALRRAVVGIVRYEILKRRDKMGFPIPLVRWANDHPGVRALVTARIGYLPDLAEPWDRGWFHDLLTA